MSRHTEPVPTRADAAVECHEPIGAAEPRKPERAAGGAIGADRSVWDGGKR